MEDSSREKVADRDKVQELIDGLISPMKKTIAGLDTKIVTARADLLEIAESGRYELPTGVLTVRETVSAKVKDHVGLFKYLYGADLLCVLKGMTFETAKIKSLLKIGAPIAEFMGDETKKTPVVEFKKVEEVTEEAEVPAEAVGF